MGDVTQVAFQIDNDSLRELDLIATSESTSRAEVLRAAVSELLRHRRETVIDQQLAAGYASRPPGPEEAAWADLSVDGLRDADLDW